MMPIKANGRGEIAFGPSQASLSLEYRIRPNTHVLQLGGVDEIEGRGSGSAEL